MPHLSRTPAGAWRGSYRDPQGRLRWVVRPTRREAWREAVALERGTV